MRPWSKDAHPVVIVCGPSLIGRETNQVGDGCGRRQIKIDKFGIRTACSDAVWSARGSQTAAWGTVPLRPPHDLHAHGGRQFCYVNIQMDVTSVGFEAHLRYGGRQKAA